MITFALVVYFGLFAVFASYMIFRSNISSFQKIILPALLFLSIAWAYIAIGYEKGYPTPIHVPDGDVVAVEVIRASKDTEGGIFIWVYPKTNDEEWKLGYLLGRNNAQRPKAYEIPYTEERAQKYLRIKENLKNGYIVKKKTPPAVGDDGRMGERQRNDYDFEVIDPRVANPKPS